MTTAGHEGREARQRGARKCTQRPESVSVSMPLQGVQENVLSGQSVCLCLFMGCKKMYSMARLCLCLCVYSSSWGARKCTQWPECVSVSVCLCLFRGCKKMYSVARVCVCVSVPLYGVQENVLNGQTVSVSVWLLLFMGCKKMYSMARVCVCVSVPLLGVHENVLSGQSVCLCVCASSWGARKCTQWPECVCVCVSVPLHGVQENVLNGQCVCLCVYSSSGGAWKCNQWPVCVSLCVYSSSGGARKCTQWPACVCVCLCMCLSVCVSIPLLGSICHAKSNGQVLPWQSQQSTAGTPCPIASPANVQACLSMFGAWVPMSVPYDIKNVIKFCKRVYPHHRNACAFSFVTVGIKYQILKA